MFSLHLYSEAKLPGCPPRARPTLLSPRDPHRTGINLAQERSDEANKRMERGWRPNLWLEDGTLSHQTESVGAMRTILRHLLRLTCKIP